MRTKDKVTTARAALYSWLAAVAAFLLAPFIVVIGQGLGAITGGCRWIGLTVPLHLQVWALVNQPSMIFSRQVAGRPLPGPGATGLLWAGKRAFNNQRPWVEVLDLPALIRSR